MKLEEVLREAAVSWCCHKVANKLLLLLSVPLGMLEDVLSEKADKKANHDQYTRSWEIVSPEPSPNTF